MDDLLREFLTESGESIAVLDGELVKLEKDPNNPELLGEIFRVVHTVKGTCGFLGLPRLEAVAHAGEDVLGKIRDGELHVTEPIVSLILEALDAIKNILAALEDTEAEPEGDDQPLIQRLRAVAEGAEAEAVEETPAEETSESVVEQPPETAEQPDEIDFEPVPAASTQVETPVAAKPAETPAAKPATGGDAKTAHKSSGDSSLANQNIRVGVDLLEHLMTMVSELVLTRNQLLQMVRGQTNSEFGTPLQRLSHVTTELQEGVMKTRMQPIGKAWAKLPRIVRDLSVELDKKIELCMLGADTELDRQVLELIKDPLTHMVRNSADHGVETIEGRKQAGKPLTGEIVLNAYHEGGHIIIEISDDGRGLAVEKIKQKAVTNGLVTAADIETMSDQQCLQLVFRPGISTAEKVTNVSGRGVGMDVVKTNVEKIGGTIELKSEVGKGTTFVIKIPLTLAIVSALIVACGGERFAIPQISVIELVRAAHNSEHSIETINGTPVLRLRDRLLPLVSLAHILELGDPSEEIDVDAEMFIVVSQVGPYSFGIIVDKVFDTEEIVVKPVAPMLRDIGVFSGNTILGDGSIVMILDLNGIAAASAKVSLAGDHHSAAATDHETRDDKSTAMLLFRAGEGAPKAVPLALVARLKEIQRAAIENSNGQSLVQYRGQLMPLVAIDYGLAEGGEGKTPVIVFSENDRSVGLVVDEIVDIVDERLDIELTADRPGVVGTAVIADKATEIVDTGHYLTQAYSDWFANKPLLGRNADKKKLLLVEDSPFFRNMLSPLLAAAGYDVTMAADGDAALKLLDGERRFDIIVSDIEMPGMNGYDFAKACRGDERFRATPIVALTAHAEAKDFELGRDAGFTDYVAKFDRDALLAALDQSLTLAGEAA